VSHMGEIWVKGPAAFALVQKLTTNDIQKLNPGGIQYTCFPNDTGGIVDDLLVYYYDKEKYLLVVNASNLDKDYKWVVDHNQEGAEVQNASDHMAQLAIQGPRAVELLQTLTQVDLSAIPYYHFESGEFAGWISYTLSKTIREFPEINDGKPYASPYDKPHDLAIVLSYELRPRIGVAANWIYSTGIPYTIPSGRYEIMGNIIPFYTGRNEYRFPNYHRLDLSVTLKGKAKPGKRWRGEWNISIYNAYARKNVWSLNFVQDKSQPDLSYAEMTYLFSIVPAITYNFKF
jgi:hypothetical protein